MAKVSQIPTQLINVATIRSPLLDIVKIIVHHHVDHVIETLPLLVGVEVQADGAKGRHYDEGQQR
jgi:hypothetical protein